MNTAPYQPRQYVPAKIDLSEIAELEPLFARLKSDLEQAQTVPQIEKWIENMGEVSAALGEYSAVKHIEMTCQTDDPEREKAYLHVVEIVDPWVKPRQFELLRMLVAKPAFAQLPAYYNVFRHSVETRVKIFREENVARETEEAKLAQQYQKICGAMTVTFEGKEQTLAAMGKILEETDRNRRQEAWELITSRRLQDKDALDDIFEKMFELRKQIAQAAGYTDYRAYTFENMERFDYKPEDCLRFHDAVEKHFVPLSRRLLQKRAQQLKLDRLRPWDLAVDPEGRPPLRPFDAASDLQEKTRRIFQRLDERLAKYFSVLGENDLLDLANRKGKAPGGYQSTLLEARVPFIFMNAVGVQRDVETLVHEAGHAFHALASRLQPLHSYRAGAPIEFCEVASMSMELLTAPYWDEFYSPQDSKRAQIDHLEDIVHFFPWMATVDAFQHWIYTNPNHTRAQRREQWLALLNRFGGIEDWSGYEEARANLWHRQLHIFEYPFYYVEYGIAQLGALQLWRNARQNSKQAIDNYLKALELGGSRPLPELFAKAGISFDFSDQIILPLVSAIEETLNS
jgi:oligoendopeptidase F